MMQSPYDPALRAEIRQRMSPPNRESVAEIARSTGVNSQTLYSWRHRWKQEGKLAPDPGAGRFTVARGPGLAPGKRQCSCPAFSSSGGLCLLDRI